jgi:ketosteroid isomerase-like protein
MRKSSLMLMPFIATMAVTIGVAAVGAPVDDATMFVRTIMDKFNSGDAKAFLKAHEDSATIVDEFGPHLWTGKGSAQHWLDAYSKDSKARGISGGRVDYGKPIAANANGNSAYIVLPTTYRFVQRGTKMAGAGSMTFVVRRSGGHWKIASWTYSGAEPAPEK